MCHYVIESKLLEGEARWGGENWENYTVAPNRHQPELPDPVPPFFAHSFRPMHHPCLSLFVPTVIASP